jgi:ubiquinone/menaquinone biosynthesis C-methylase UbiE
MLEIARRRLPGAAAVRGDALDLPFADDSFDRVFTANFYGHLQNGERERFLAEARRVAPELVVVDARLRPGGQRAEWQERVLNDGSQFRVFKRFFTPSDLLDELGGGTVLLENHWFVAVRSHRP